MTHPQVFRRNFTPTRRFLVSKTPPSWPHIPSMTQYRSAPPPGRSSVSHIPAPQRNARVYEVIDKKLIWKRFRSSIEGHKYADTRELLSSSLFLLTTRIKLQLHDAIYLLRFYSNSLIHILSLSNSHNNVASIQKNRGDKSHRVIAVLGYNYTVRFIPRFFCIDGTLL